jgi:hypothetical protein
MVAGVDLRFRVSNFTQANMDKVEATWDVTRTSLLRAATLLNRFGLSTRSLTAHSVVVPIAYFLASKGHDDGYLDSSASATDRSGLQAWVNRSLMKRGIWGSGLDTTLSRIRQAIDAHDENGFPVEAVEKEMATIGKSLDFAATEIDELLEVKYGGQRTFPVLAMLYPGLDLSKAFHEDHVFPRSRFTPKRLRDADVPAEQIDMFRDAVDRLPNLQLLSGLANIEKQAVPPHEWLASTYPSPEQRQTYITENDLSVMPETVAEFMTFYETRKGLLRSRLLKVLGVADSGAAPDGDSG